MKQPIIVFTVVITMLFLGGFGLASATDSTQVQLPVAKVQSLSGKSIKSSDVIADSGVYVVCFWATWCKPCIQELNTYADLYERWQKEFGIHLVAVSIDDARTVSKVAPYVKGRNWKFDVIMDVNSDFKRAMNVNNAPHTFLVKNGAVIWQHAAFASGDEDDLEQQLRLAMGPKGAE
ncbi:MAG: TlpA disulfide reductase family protein [bacterium]|nr:TlpA disulfide reductase family protein [bacterium]